MKIDTEGVYTLQYTAEDECGNVTVEERTVSVENITYRTVLYTDGTFIINEKSSDIDANVALHGVATNVYDPFDPNGNTDKKKYIFPYADARPWSGVASQVKKVEIGSRISPKYTKFWFQEMHTCTAMDLSQLDTSNVTTMANMFYECRALTTLDLSNFDTNAVTNMPYMFYDCRALTTLDLSSFDTSAVKTMANMFYECRALTTLDLSSFDTSAVTNMRSLFAGCGVLTTIYASLAFVVTQVTQSATMFSNTSQLVGGAGTTWNSNNPSDKTYARIDNPPDAPGYFTLKTA
ncbi:MAG: BspA family leucine-rich repeat surface protein [Acutalibacteraceae bacterium]|nr:BspA family leucine-rich repeat surface protein [Acutalibacteraceae bacterium]